MVNSNSCYSAIFQTICQRFNCWNIVPGISCCINTVCVVKPSNIIFNCTTTFGIVNCTVRFFYCFT